MSFTHIPCNNHVNWGELASGIWDVYGANTINTINTIIPWMTRERGETVPFLIFVAVLAIASVAGIPPNNGVIIFAIPCPWVPYCCWRLFVILSATTADRRDSIPPRRVMTKAIPRGMAIIPTIVLSNYIVGNGCQKNLHSRLINSLLILFYLIISIYSY